MTQVSERPARRVDGSMSLLVDMMTNSLDASYAEAAARKSGIAGEPTTAAQARRNRSRQVIAVILLVGLGVVAGTAAAQVRSREASRSGIRAELVADVQRSTRSTDDLARTAARLRDEVGAARDAGLSAGAAGRAAAEQLAALELAAGLVAVTGPGLVVRLDDAPPAAAGEQVTGPDNEASDDGRVLDRDLQDVVNALFGASAEAISINGLRLTSQTAIRSAGDAILVDYRPLSPPYTVRAIGNPKVLEPAFVDGVVGRRLATFTSLYGLELSVQRTDRHTLPGSGAPTLRVAQAEGAAS